jgi:hypothetical protein
VCAACALLLAQMRDISNSAFFEKEVVLLHSRIISNTSAPDQSASDEVAENIDHVKQMDRKQLTEKRADD